MVQFCGSLQYIDDYRSAIVRACSFQPRFLHLLKLPVGTFPTFATAQRNIAGSVIPVWFFNESELVDLCASQNYRLAYHGMHERVYDTSNFDLAHRMTRYSHLLFTPL
jgi:hypothetical protein